MLIGRQSAILYRFGPETYDPDTGRTVKPVAVEIPITGSFQPLSGSDREALPEGVRTSVEWKLYTRSQVKTADQFGKFPADEIDFHGDRFLVYRVEPRQSLIPHFKIYLIRKREISDGSGIGLQSTLQSELG